MAYELVYVELKTGHQYVVVELINEPAKELPRNLENGKG